MKAVLLTILALGLAGCAAREPRTPGPAASPAAVPGSGAQEVILMGHFEQRVASGGEISGWTLVYDQKRVDALFSVAALAQVREGGVFAAKGVFQKRSYPERGEVQVFVIREMSETIID